MLVLGRKQNESIVIGDNIRITIVGRSGSTIKLGVQAPPHVRVMRSELVDELSSEPDVERARHGVLSSKVLSQLDLSQVSQMGDWIADL